MNSINTYKKYNPTNSLKTKNEIENRYSGRTDIGSIPKPDITITPALPQQNNYQNNFNKLLLKNNNLR
jgi:hypothetical protein